MDSIVIEGGIPLIGNIKISGSKNASLPIMVASLLTEETITLSNVPILSDIATMKELLANHGTFIEEQAAEDGLVLKLKSRTINNFTAPYEIVRKMRASIWVLGPLLARFGRAKVSLPGGCAIGARQVDLHIAALTAMGVDISIEEGYIKAKARSGYLRGCEFSFAKSSVGATINALLAAVLARGDSILSNCATEPEIVDLCNVLVKMGAKIEGIGTRELSIAGQGNLRACTHNILPDRIEAGTYMISAAITRGDLKISGIDYHIVDNLASRLSEAGVSISHKENVIHVCHKGEIKPVDITTQPYPGFSTDLQAQFMALMTLCSGSSIITEDIFENRFMHVPELCRMGANISITGNSALIRGIKQLSGAEVMASDLRASVSLVLAALAAQGKTRIRRVYHLDRGYQMIEKKLMNCGANIQRVYGDSV